MSGSCQIEIALPPAAASALVAEVAGDFGAEWSPDAHGGRLVLPVVYGLRQGTATGRLEIERLGDEGSRLRWAEEESQLSVHRSAVAILLMAAVPVVGSVAWPFWPALFPLVPYAAIFGLIAWWLVISRLKTSGPEEFLKEIVAAQAASQGDSA